MSAIFAGIDLASDSRPLGFALLDADARLIELRHRPMTNDELVAAASGAAITGVDAPLSLPNGLCCLDIACGCVATHPSGVRTAELAVRAAGIGLFATTKRTIIPGLVARGLTLRARFEERGARVIEVYPHGTKLRLFGRAPARKSTAAGRHWVAEGLSPLVRGLPAGRVLYDDEADAILAAYTALLVARGEARAYGDPAEGAIWLPETRPSLAPAASDTVR